MNIIQINTVDNKGGAAKVAYWLKNKLAELGNKTDMFVKLKYSNDPTVHLTAKSNEISVLLKKITGKDVGSFLANKIRPILANDIDFFKTDHILETPQFKNADIIHCHNLHGNYFKLETLVRVSKLKPVVWTLHDMWAVTAHCAYTDTTQPIGGFYKCQNLSDYQSLSWDNSKYLENKKRSIYNKSNLTIVVPSLWLKDIVSKSVLRDKDIIHIPNGIDTLIFKPKNKLESRKLLGLPENKKIVLFSATGATTNKHKGWRFAQKIADQYKTTPNIAFLCIGKHDLKKHTERNVTFIPYINDENILASYYSACDIFLFTSTNENFPLVILEAMATGLPIISFDTGGVKEAVIHKENGYIAKHLDEIDLKKGFDYLLNLPQKDLDMMSKNSIQRVKENFTLEIMTQKYLSIYQELLNK